MNIVVEFINLLIEIDYTFSEENITQEMFPFLMEDDLKMLIPEMRERAIFRKRVQEAATANEASARSSYSISVTRAAVYLAVRTNCPQTNQLPLSITITNMNKF